jgi:hypothetical protein
MSDRRPDPALAALGVVALVAAGVAIFVSTDLFPYLSTNHDEGVYLQQAAMLLEGKLWLETPVADAVRPWFFVQDGRRLYPKYNPVPAAMFAVGLAVERPRLSLGALAAATVALVGLLTRELFDDRTAVVAAVLLVASPLFVLQSAVFLPYAPTFALEVLFALAYVRACRRTRPRVRRAYAVLAGSAIGLAFFARPFTAVLFAAPFVGHALLTMLASWRASDGSTRPWLPVGRRTLARNGLVAGTGLAFVLVTLAYNHVVTGDALLFPYEAFAPRDGPGFGVRRLLGYELTYTPSMAVWANATVLGRFATGWTAAPPLGTVAAAVGLGYVFSRTRVRAYFTLPAAHGLSDRAGTAVVAGLLVSVPLGNLFFWGNRNLLGNPADPTHGLLAVLGPFYHFDLLLPLSVFGAVGVVATGRALYQRVAGRWSPAVARGTLAVAVLAVVVVGGFAQAAAVADPVTTHRSYTEQYEQAYEPFTDRDLGDALVFVPTPYGPWLNHPFQSLRNDPDLDGPTVYVQDRDATGNLQALEHFDGRTPYRYTYRGTWTGYPDPDDVAIDPVLQRLSVRRSTNHSLTTTVGTIEGSTGATVRLRGADGAVHYGVDDTDLGETVTVDWRIRDGRATVAEEGLTRFSDRASVAVEGPTDLVLLVTFTQVGGATVTYRQELTVDTADGGETVEVLWPPTTRVCPLATDCGHEGTVVDGRDRRFANASLEQHIETAGR